MPVRGLVKGFASQVTTIAPEPVPALLPAPRCSHDAPLTPAVQVIVPPPAL
ncbi:MAG: hypothetical protein NT167_25080 [Verrucomicrobia bacterium]|nr:hypothetical protein [Verrucomicrobiota bacterium]